MFGIWRYFLSLCVFTAHTAAATWSWGSSQFYGMYAVFCFYVLSGYLISRVLNERYGFSRKGVIRFSVNRLLRLYPGYWAGAVFALTVVIALPALSRQTGWGYVIPDSLPSWLSAIFIVGSRLKEGCRLLIPQAWSLSVELLFYALMALGLSRHRGIALVWFVASLAGTYWFVIIKRIDLSNEGYLSHAAGSLPFSPIKAAR